MRVLVTLTLLACLAGGCGGPASSTTASPPPAATAAPAPTQVAHSSAASASTAPSPATAEPVSPAPPAIAACDPLPVGAASPAPAAGKAVHLVLPSGGWAVAQTELTSPGGVRVLTDVATPSDLTRPATKADILLTTHHDPDHWNDTWANEFPGESYPGGQPLTRKDVRITAIPASHFGGTLADGTDTIFVIDIAGLRIVNFGDLGQDSLNPRQLATIGTPDIAFSQLSNEYSSMSLANRKGYLLMAQVCPRLFVPTHMMEGNAVAALAADTWPTRYTEAPTLELRAAMLPNRTTVLLAGGNASMGKSLGVPMFGS